ncbi:MAG: tyrosine-type recombinase/integrase, partial [Bdellovibrionales bacterium]
FRNEKGLPICHDNFSDRQFAKDLKAWGGKRIRFHDLRHTSTTLMIANGVDIKTVKEICGHADITTTMNYVHLLSGSIANVSKVFSLKPSFSEKEVAAEKKLKLV